MVESSGGGGVAGAERRPGRREAPRMIGVIGPFALFALLRVPSFLEPHWYTDEAGYVTTARAVLHGKLLYAQIWTNKPPLDIWTVAATIRVLGTSEAALHAVTLVSGALTLLAVAHAARRLVGPWRATVILVLAAFLLGTPLFDAELLLPESLLIVPVTWAGALLVTRVASPDARRWPRWPLAVGLLAAAAVAYQQTALAETCAFGLLLALSPVGSRGRRLAMYLAGFAGLTLLWLVPTLALAGPTTVAQALVGFWVPFTQAQYPTGGGDVILSLLPSAASLALLIGAAWLLRSDRGTAWRLWLWAGAALLVAAVARQPYPHYLLPSVAPAALAFGTLRLPTRQTVGQGARGMAVAGLGIGWLLAVGGGSVAGADWLVPGDAGSGGLVAYYGGAVATLTHRQSLTAYQDAFDRRVGEDAAVASWISGHGLDGTTAVVWSADAWLYSENHLQLLLPTPPIYNDEVLLGETGQVAQRVRELRPELIVTDASSVAEFPDITPVLEAGYTQVARSGGEIVWLRNDVVQAVVGPPHQVAVAGVPSSAG